MESRIPNIQGYKFSTGIMATTDIHNAGSVFGCLYRLVLSFDTSTQVHLYSEIILNGGLVEWKESIQKIDYIGLFDDNQKHLRLQLEHQKDAVKCDAYLELMDETILFGEFYFDGETYPRSLVFEKIKPVTN